MFKTTRQIGNSGENLACKYLISQGYKIITRNYTIRGGEIDIIAKEDEELVFVEVKLRFGNKYGYAREAITPWKLVSLHKTALFYIQKINWGNKPYRFDLLAIDYDSKGESTIELLRNI